jgi:hypothetical protein
MVDMFESPDYQTHYFGGEEGRQVWENFIADSRAEHEANIGNRISGYVYVDPEEREQHYSEESVVTFSEITAEEADRLTEERAVFGEDRVYAEPPQFEDTGMHPEDDDGGITFEEITEPQQTEPIQAQPTPQPQTVQPSIDLASLIATIRDEVRREFEVQMAAQQLAKPAYSDEPAAEPEYDTADEADDTEEITEQPAEEPGYEETETEAAEDIDDTGDSEETGDTEETDSGFVPKFDIMALLDEQLESYGSMTLEARMEEIDVRTMEVSLDELAAYIKESRNKRGV